MLFFVLFFDDLSVRERFIPLTVPVINIQIQLYNIVCARIDIIVWSKVWFIKPNTRIDLGASFVCVGGNLSFLTGKTETTFKVVNFAVWIWIEPHQIELLWRSKEQRLSPDCLTL